MSSLPRRSEGNQVTECNGLVSTVIAKFVLYLCDVRVLMKLIDFGKIGEHFEKTLRFPFRRKRSLRTNIVLTVIEAIVTGFFLGAALIEYLHGRGVLSWIWPLGMAFTSGLTTLSGTLAALHNCPRPTKTPENEAALHNVRA